MYLLCNSSFGLSSNNENIHVNFTECSKLTDATNRTSLTLKDDAKGAMQYTVAVVLVYSIAVLGVFGLGLYNSRRNRRGDTDRETRAFMKNYEEVRRTCEQRCRLCAVTTLIHQLHKEPVNSTDVSTVPMNKSIALLPVSLSSVTKQEFDNSQTPQNMFDVSRDNIDIAAEKSADDGLKVHKQYSGRIQRTMLGSSRRSYKYKAPCNFT